jgi:DNA-binding XRE family transcriptional regulator
MPSPAQITIDHRTVELDGVRYVILRQSVFLTLCKMANIPQDDSMHNKEDVAAALDLDQPSLAHKLVQRRQASGLSQAELARRAGVRVETLNRIERGKTTPDFATIRKLVLAMNTAEQNLATRSMNISNT